jgi:hypothetical protein
VTTWLLVGGATALLFELDVLRFLGSMALFAGVSLMIITWAIGFVVYFNHTHPRLKWYGCTAQWREGFSQQAGGCHVTFSGIWWYVLPNVVMNHTLHHLDTRPRAPSGGRRDASRVRHRYAPPVLALDPGAPLRGDETLWAV